MSGAGRGLSTGLAAALALGSLVGGPSAADWGKAELRRSRRELFRRYLITHSARTPKPEVMFANLIKDGQAKIVPRRGKSPLLVWVKL